MLVEPFRRFRDLICTIPGISTTVAVVVIAETDADMSVFPSPGHLAAWAGVALAARYHRLVARRGKLKANVAVQRTMLVAIWKMAMTGVPYRDLGADYYTQRRPDRAKRRALHQLAALGYNVTLEPAT